MTRSPAITSTSLLASAMVLPASMAASTASSAAVPDEAHSTMSTSGCVATRDQALGAGADARAGRSAQRRAQARRAPSSVAIDTARGR